MIKKLLTPSPEARSIYSARVSLVDMQEGHWRPGRQTHSLGGGVKFLGFYLQPGLPFPHSQPSVHEGGCAGHGWFTVTPPVTLLPWDNHADSEHSLSIYCVPAFFKHESIHVCDAPVRRVLLSRQVTCPRSHTAQGQNNDREAAWL